MKANIIPIGNSKGVRIPKSVLEQCHFSKEVSMIVEGDTLILKSINKKPRQGWDEAFKMMRQRGEDKLLIDDNIDLDMKGWEW
jgi:antitoxin MazE